MPTGHFEELEKQYNANIKPVTEKQLGMPILNEGELAGKTPDDTWPTPDKKAEGGTVWNQSGPEAAEGFEAPKNDDLKKREDKTTGDEDALPALPTSNPQDRENGEKVVKKESNKINNSTMKENNKYKSSFDKLYEDVFNDEMDIETGDEGGFEDEMGDDFGDDEGGDTVTLELDRDVAEKLHGLLGDILGGEGDIDDIEDTLEGDGLGDEEDTFPESHVELEAGPSDAVSKLATQNGGNNKVGGDVNPAGSGGGEHAVSGQEDGGKPKAQPDGVGKLATKNGGNNKVGGKVTGGGKHMFKH